MNVCTCTSRSATDDQERANANAIGDDCFLMDDEDDRSITFGICAVRYFVVFSEGTSHGAGKFDFIRKIDPA